MHLIAPAAALRAEPLPHAVAMYGLSEAASALRNGGGDAARGRRQVRGVGQRDRERRGPGGAASARFCLLCHNDTLYELKGQCKHTIHASNPMSGVQTVHCDFWVQLLLSPKMIPGSVGGRACICKRLVLRVTIFDGAGI